MSRAALLGVAGIVLVAVVYGARLIDPPSVERLRRFDQRRVEDLGAIKRSVEIYYVRRGRLPAALAELGEVAPAGLAIADPVSHEAYAYSVQREREYTLCAGFALASGPAPPRSLSDPWLHPSGLQCFPIEVTTKGP